MYSSVNNHEKLKSILSFSEIIGIIIVFSFMLYLLFPKGNIEDYLENQGDHANLSIHYLENMLLYHPDNAKLKMTLIEKYVETGKERKALKLNTELINTNPSKTLLTKLYKTDYLLEQTLYFQKTNPQKLQQLKDKLLNYYKYTESNRDYSFFFSESSKIDYSYLKYHSLRHLIEKNPDTVDYELEKMAYDLASQLGYKEESFSYLEKLIKYPQLSDELKEYLVYSLFERYAFTKARKIATGFFLQSQTDDELTQYFHLALYALVQDHTKTPTEVSQLIQDYANLKDLLAPDIMIILSTLLDLGEAKEAANFAINMFYTNPESFNETGIDMAIQSLLWNSELEHARAFSFFAEGFFEKQKYLDKTIEITTWLSEDEAVAALNEQGYYKYKSKKYEEYFLKNEDLNFYHETLHHIYTKRIAQKEYKFIDNMGRYYDHTGEIPKAAIYFTNLYQTTKQKKALYHAIDFSYKNSAFKKGLKLYTKYQATYGAEPKLHDLSIKKLLALKQFDEAYAMTKSLEQNNFLNKKQRFTDLAWLEKDYDYLHKQFENFEATNNLEANHFEYFLLLEKALNNGHRLNDLYQKAWKKTHNIYHLTALMYKLLEEKKLKEFSEVLANMSKKEQDILDKNIEFQTLLAHYYVATSNISLALNAYEQTFKLSPNKVSSHQSYLWFLVDNQNKHPELKKKITDHLHYLEQHPTLQENVGIVAIVAAMSQQKHTLATKWLKKALRANPNNKEYRLLANDIKILEQEKVYEHYHKTLDPDYLDTHINFKTKHLGSLLTVNQGSFSQQWKLYQNIKSKLILQHYNYKTANGQTSKQTSLSINLKNSNKNFLWDFNLAQTDAYKDFTSASLNLKYNTHNFNVNLNSKYQNKTTLTPELEHNALESSLELNIQAYLNRRISFNLLGKKSEFETINGLDIGEARRVQLSANYVLRSGYPDISFNTYVSNNQFSKNIAQDYSEFGIASSIGTARRYTLNSSWKPFGTVAFAMNDSQDFGGSFTFGLSKMLEGDDSLDIHFDYYNGIGVISEPIYGLNIGYRF